MTVFEEIYNNMIGLYNPEYSMESVENAFTPGSACMLAYGQMRDAYERVCQRLGVVNWEDEDLEIIVNSMETIQKDLCRRMFWCGIQIAGNK